MAMAIAIARENPVIPTMDFPLHFRCPISMELMQDPVIISTGVTYERKNIKKWFSIYEKKTCPATMQCIDNFDITPNHTLKRLISAWEITQSQSCTPSNSIKKDEMVSLIDTVESTPFKVTSLKKLKSILEMGDEIQADFKKSGGVQVVIKIVVQILVESSDFVTFRACEEAIAVLHQLKLSDEDETIQLLMKPECLKSMAVILQRGSAEARFCTVSIFEKMGKADTHCWNHSLLQDQGIDFFKSLLEISSDEICSKASSCALQVLIDISQASKKSRLKTIEAGAICTLIELVSDSNRLKCEKIMYLIKLLCESADGRLAFIEHGLGIAAVSKKLLNVSNVVTKICVKILWLICNNHPNEKVLEDMLLFGSVKKLIALLHIGGQSSTRERVSKIFKLHGNTWSRYPCFSREMKAYLGFGSDFC